MVFGHQVLIGGQGLDDMGHLIHILDYLGKLELRQHEREDLGFKQGLGEVRSFKVK